VASTLHPKEGGENPSRGTDKSVERELSSTKDNEALPGFVANKAGGLPAFSAIAATAPQREPKDPKHACNAAEGLFQRADSTDFMLLLANKGRTRIF
jgi:hypothetical protein